MMDLLEQLEFEQLKQSMYMLYGLKLDDVRRSKYGVGSSTYFVTCAEARYVVKYISENEMNNPEIEIALCEYLLKQNISVCRFVKNKQGQVLSVDENGRIFNIQHFISGLTYKYNEAPDWLMEEAAVMLGKIHKCLENYNPLPSGIGADFFKYRTPQGTLASYEGMLKNLEQIEPTHLENIQSNMELMKHFPKYEFDLSKLTCRNTHGDYTISQLLCGEDKINAVIDWTSACVHPVIWEIMRSYVYASPLCRSGEIDIEDFLNYIKAYMRYGTLNSYDLENMGKLFYYTIAVSNFYGQYYTSITRNREMYLQQAVLSAKLMKWFDKNIEHLTTELIKLK